MEKKPIVWVTRSANKASAVDGFRREGLQKLVQMRLEERSRMESRTIK